MAHGKATISGSGGAAGAVLQGDAADGKGIHRTALMEVDEPASDPSSHPDNSPPMRSPEDRSDEGLADLITVVVAAASRAQQ